QRLAEAGVPNAQVSVTRKDGADGHELKVQIEAQHDGKTHDHGEIPQLVLRQNGAPITGNGFTVRIENRRAAAGIALSVLVTQDGRSATATVPHSDTMSDAALADAVRSQLTAAGLHVQVSATHGRIDVRPD